MKSKIVPRGTYIIAFHKNKINLTNIQDRAFMKKLNFVWFGKNMMVRVDSPGYFEGTHFHDVEFKAIPQSLNEVVNNQSSDSSDTI